MRSEDPQYLFKGDGEVKIDRRSEIIYNKELQPEYWEVFGRLEDTRSRLDPIERPWACTGVKILQTIIIIC